jgi:hypothetical protein
LDNLGSNIEGYNVVICRFNVLNFNPLNEFSIDCMFERIASECDRSKKHLPLERGGKKQNCQAKPQFVGCDCAIHLCNHPLLKVTLSRLAKEFESETVYI